ncbi:MAG TPA: hypothetical protein VHZ54_14265 [Solirubrobacterales bacterium]|nr:hypothetical protein [Solirubrobacterales bacterium]
MPQHIIEIWEMVDDRRKTIYTAACLSCGWTGEATSSHPVAVRRGEEHEAGLGPPRPPDPAEGIRASRLRDPSLRSSRPRR